MSIDIKADGLEKAAKLLGGIPNGLEDAYRLSLNRALTSGRAAAVKEARARYTVGAKDIRQTMTLEKASKQNLEARLVSRGARLKLSAYAHNPKESTTGANRKPVRVTMQKGKSFTVDKGFVHKKQIFARVGKKSYPIQMQFGQAVPRILDDEAIAESIQQEMQETVEKRLEHEALRILERKA